MKKKPEPNPLDVAPERRCECGAVGPGLVLFERFAVLDKRGNRTNARWEWFCRACLFDEPKESAA